MTSAKSLIQEMKSLIRKRMTTTQLIERDFYNLKNKVQGVVYCLSDDFVNVAEREIGVERLKKYLRGE